jgi:hypothetical protein
MFKTEKMWAQRVMKGVKEGRRSENDKIQGTAIANITRGNDEKQGLSYSEDPESRI